jgi:hypothetical protein
MAGRVNTLTDYAWIFENLRRNDICAVRPIQAAQHHRRGQLSHKSSKQNSAREHAESGIENVFSHIRRHSVPLFFDVEKHKMDGILPKIIQRYARKSVRARSAPSAVSELMTNTMFLGVDASIAPLSSAIGILA